MCLVSIFTPTHNPQYLLDAYNSLKAQTYQNYEWIILPNGDKTIEIPREIATDSHVKLLDQTQPSHIGSLKARCCWKAKGELLLELDHDDWLREDALAQVVATYTLTQPGFIHSDCFRLDKDNEDQVFDAGFGWDHYETEYRGKTHKINKSFPIDAFIMTSIGWQPDHVRVWSRQAYEKIGGHKGYDGGDDHDLMCRTYLSGYDFHYIPEPLYIYRRHEQHSYMTKRNEIWGQVAKNTDNYLHDLIIEWCRRTGYSMYDMNGATACPSGFVSRPNLLEDIGDIEHNSVGVFRCVEALQLIDNERIPKLINSMYDCLAPGGWIISTTPAISDNDGRIGLGAYQDPRHKSRWCKNSTWYYTDKNYAKNLPDNHCRFSNVRCSVDYPTDWHRKNFLPYLVWDAYALKGQRTPGYHQI